MSNIRVIEKKGEEPGKTIAVISGIHGNEKGGIEAVDEIVKTVKIKKGKVLFIYGNLKAIEENKRFIDYNLNRCFRKHQPEEISESLEGKTAKEIMPYLDKTDHMLDLHASNSPESVPFIICEPHSFELAKILPSKIISTNWDKFQPGSTDNYMNLQNKISAGMEIGYLGDPEGKNKAKNAITNFLIWAGAIEGKISENREHEFYKVKSLYKNTEAPFKKTRDFADFEVLKEKTLIGKEGNNEVYRENGEIIAFVRDREELNSECFIVLEKTDE